ncbi:uncharacterized protein PV09_05694 [Verruconis gallopava]|uniref:COP9 signalosome complex subunit 3 N-terminal helical repeats domain-containing protein n=1 Tax=Verruconis gallopava TaxID=253628 RepID=A0A0D1YR62_9PEZI|nr:uncharacterized protein PV09_05694 [Verruconis gallopava]KIW03042.1 hypothetical protein PV09_05694 [Verruconis gallopava]
MAAIASHLLEFPPEGTLSPDQYHSRIKSFIDSLSKTDPVKILKADGQQDLLQVLDPGVNSISYLFILSLRYKAFLNAKPQSPEEARHILSLISGFMQVFDGVQMRYVGMLFRDTVEFALNLAAQLGMTQQIVNPLVAAIFRLDPSSGTLTSTHLKLLRICLAQRMYHEALPVLQATIHSFPSPKFTAIEGQYPCSTHQDSSAYITEASGLSDKLTTYDVHEFFLLGGMILIGLQRWEDARLYLECVIISPSGGSPSIFQVEAYKKWVLVGCIIKGTLLEAPKATNQTVLRNVKSISRAYDTVVEVFQSGHAARLNAEIAAGNEIWHEDGNLGLIQLLVSRLPRFHILSMRDIYSAVPLTTVSSWLSIPPDTLHAFVEEMVSEGALNASIDLDSSPDSGAVLRFYSNQATGPLAKSEKQYHAELLAQTQRTNAMAEYVKMSDRRLTLTKEYVEALRRRMKNKEGDQGMATTGEPLDETGGLDEDIMMDE